MTERRGTDARGTGPQRTGAQEANAAGKAHRPPPAERRERARRSTMDRLSEAERARMHELMTEFGIRRDDPDWVLLFEAGLVRDAIADARAAFREDARAAVRQLLTEIRHERRQAVRREAGKLVAIAVLAGGVLAAVAGGIGYGAGVSAGRQEVASSIAAIERARPLTDAQRRLLALTAQTLPAADDALERCRDTARPQGDGGGEVCTVPVWRQLPDPGS